MEFLKIKFIAILMLFLITPLVNADENVQAEINKEIQETLETLQSLITTSQKKEAILKEKLKLLKKQDTQSDEEEKEQSYQELQAELKLIKIDLESVATGVDIGTYRKIEPETFNLNQEFERLIQPMIYALNSMTTDSREIEQLKQDLESIDDKKSVASKAINRLDLLLEKESDENLKIALEKMRENWQLEFENNEGDQKIVKHRLKTKLESKGSFIASTRDVFSDFFKNRGLNLLLGFVAFFAVFLFLRFFYSIVKKIWHKRNSQRLSTFDRLIDLLSLLFTFVISMIATLFVFNLRNDWLLLGISGLFLIAMGWVLIKTLPMMIEKIMLLLNLGSVREGERVILNGVSWKVDRLHFYSHLINPDLTGGSLHVPLRELVGLVSRPSANDEEWFPCKVGEWVQLEEKPIGKVVYQSPEMVDLEIFGGAHQTYTTETFMSLNPTNLSRGYRIQMVFGIDYKYQAQCTTDIPDKMRAMFIKDLIELMGEDQLIKAYTDFFLPNASSLDFEYEAFVKGTSAHLYEEVERVMVYSFANACNKYGWEIPFQQITLHQSDVSKEVK
ncbi:MAG: hypothetical protein AB8D52_12825 [Gammaproteobacteria bacterium]